MVEDATAAASGLRTLAYDPDNIKTLRMIHDELGDSPAGRSRSDTLVLAEVMSLLTSRRLYMFEQGRTMVLTYEMPEAEEQPWEDAQPMVTRPPPPPPEPVATPAMVAQATALREAAESGAPFCEE